MQYREKGRIQIKHIQQKTIYKSNRDRLMNINEPYRQEDIDKIYRERMNINKAYRHREKEYR